MTHPTPEVKAIEPITKEARQNFARWGEDEIKTMPEFVAIARDEYEAALVAEEQKTAALQSRIEALEGALQAQHEWCGLVEASTGDIVLPDYYEGPEHIDIAFDPKRHGEYELREAVEKQTRAALNQEQSESGE